MKVLVTGRITVYEVRGTYQIDVLTMRPVGEGELQIAFEQLKRKLDAEGLFDPEHKVPLPSYPESIGIVTSASGAALHDVLNVMSRRFPSVEVILSPVRVQGIGASLEIAGAIRDLNRYGLVDVILLTRGGGTLEDLWAFNEENVARAIHASSIPVMSAVGHEIDFTISDFVADARAPTPSAAAEMLVPERAAILETIGNNWYTIHDNVTAMLKNLKDTIKHLLGSYSFNRPLDLLRQTSQRVDELHRGMTSAINHRIALSRTVVASLDQRIKGLNPAMVLRRGYAMVLKNDRIVSSRRSLKQDDTVELRFHDGSVHSVVYEE
jgi:exodeoxyribonuclease VII large subunit